MDSIEHQKLAQALFKRYKANPVLSPQDWPYPVNAVFNPGAVMLNGQTLLLVRVEDLRGFSHLTVARSDDGLTNWQIDDQPTLKPNHSLQEEKWGLEDPRIIWLEEQRQFAITYVSFGEGGPIISLAITKNFRAFARLGGMLPPEDKDACLFPRRFNGRFALIHRPIVRGEAHIWLSLSPDLKHWGDHRMLLKTRQACWDCHRVGLACQPLELEEGWLIIYHGVRITTGGAIYRVGMALLDLNEPWKVLRRGEEWVLGPQADYERIGDVGVVVFPTGATIHKETNQLYLYYGAADSKIALAIANMDDVRKYIMNSPRVDQ